MTAAQAASVLRALTEANVQLVVVGDADQDAALRLVVASHPTNLEALGKVLDRLGATLSVPEAAAGEPLRLAGPEGSMTVSTRHGAVDLLLGGPGGSLYADTVEIAERRTVAGVDVRWVPNPPPVPRSDRRSPKTVAHRLLSIADAVAGSATAPAPAPDAPDGAVEQAPDATKGTSRGTRPSRNDA